MKDENNLLPVPTNEELELFEVIGADGNNLKFTGELVAAVSAELPEKLRHTEFKLYLTSFDTWILQGVGRTKVEGEHDRYWYIVSSEPNDWLDKIVGEDVSRLAKRLIRDAFVYLKNCDPYED